MQSIICCHNLCNPLYTFESNIRGCSNIVFILRMQNLTHIVPACQNAVSKVLSLLDFLGAFFSLERSFSENSREVLGKAYFAQITMARILPDKYTVENKGNRANHSLFHQAVLHRLGPTLALKSVVWGVAQPTVLSKGPWKGKLQCDSHCIHSSSWLNFAPVLFHIPHLFCKMARLLFRTWRQPLGLFLM